MARLPGVRLLRVANDWFDAATVARVFEPLVADWQREYLSAPVGRARVTCRVRGAFAFCSTFVSLSPRALASPLRIAVDGAAWLWLAVFSLLACVLQVPMFDWPSNLIAQGCLVVWLAPSFLAAAVPFALVPVGLRLAQSAGPEWARRRALVRCALVVTTAHCLALGWLVPAANQAWRVGTHDQDHDRRPLVRGPRELTAIELVSHDPAAASATATRKAVRDERHNRASFALAPLALALLGWALGQVVRRAGAVKTLGWWLLIGTAFLGLRAASVPWGLSLPVAMWLPIVAALAAAAVLRAAWRPSPAELSASRP
jgi:hypothetical protein